LVNVVQLYQTQYQVCWAIGAVDQPSCGHVPSPRQTLVIARKNCFKAPTRL
jgi:hypothetical protein